MITVDQPGAAEQLLRTPWPGRHRHALGRMWPGVVVACHWVSSGWNKAGHPLPCGRSLARLLTCAFSSQHFSSYPASSRSDVPSLCPRWRHPSTTVTTCPGGVEVRRALSGLPFGLALVVMAFYLEGRTGLEPVTSSVSGNVFGRSCFRILPMSCGV